MIKLRYNVLFLLLSLFHLHAAAYTPESVLREGADTIITVNPYTHEIGEVKKGTLAATLNNITRLNELLAQDPTARREDEIKAIITIVNRLIPSLNIMGVFNLFEPDSWIGKGDQLGRIVVLALYLQQFPHQAVKEYKAQLMTITHSVESACVKGLIQAL